GFHLDQYLRVLSPNQGGWIRGLSPALAQAVASHHYYFGIPADCSQFCGILGNPGKREAQHNPVHDLFYPLMKALVAIGEDGNALLEPCARAIRVLCPVVILAGPLYYL